MSDDIDEVIMGMFLLLDLDKILQDKLLFMLEVPVSKPAHIINQVCGSGLRSVVSGYQSIKLR
jgi:acetyl-CoA C-acetyltransferase